MSRNITNPNDLKVTTVLTGTTHTLDPLKDKAIDCANISGDCTITVPLASTLPPDAILRTCWIVNNSSTYTVTIQLSGSNVFRTNNSKIVLGYEGDTARIAGAYRADGVTGWLDVSTQWVTTLARRNATWAASNFTSYTAIPFDTTDVQTLDQIIEHETVTNPSRITVKKDGLYRLEYNYDIDSTGGIPNYNIQTRVRKNGSTEIPGCTTRTGNYPSEDQSGSLAGVPMVLAENDYIEVEIINTGLTGNLVNATATLSVLN